MWLFFEMRPTLLETETSGSPSPPPRQWSQAEKAKPQRSPAHRQFTCWETMAQEQEHRPGMSQSLLCAPRNLKLGTGLGRGCYYCHRHPRSSDSGPGRHLPQETV